MNYFMCNELLQYFSLCSLKIQAHMDFNFLMKKTKMWDMFKFAIYNICYISLWYKYEIRLIGAFFSDLGQISLKARSLRCWSTTVTLPSICCSARDGKTFISWPLLWHKTLSVSLSFTGVAKYFLELTAELYSYTPQEANINFVTGSLRFKKIWLQALTLGWRDPVNSLEFLQYFFLWFH